MVPLKAEMKDVQKAVTLDELLEERMAEQMVG